MPLILISILFATYLVALLKSPENDKQENKVTSNSSSNWEELLYTKYYFTKTEGNKSF
jgi:hypothetical protein